MERLYDCSIESGAGETFYNSFYFARNFFESESFKIEKRQALQKQKAHTAFDGLPYMASPGLKTAVEFEHNFLVEKENQFFPNPNQWSSKN